MSAWRTDTQNEEPQVLCAPELYKGRESFVKEGLLTKWFEGCFHKMRLKNNGNFGQVTLLL